jgi:hypothetical protein
MLSLWPTTLVPRLIAIGVALLALAGVIFALYMYLETTQNRLIAQAQIAARAEVVTQYQAQSSEIQRQQARSQAGALVGLVNSDAAASSQAADVQTQIQTITEPKPPITPAKKEDANVDPEMVKAIDAINRDNDAVDSLLESASGAARPVKR